MSRPPFRTLLGPLWRSKRRAWVCYARRLVGSEVDAEDVVQDAACASLQANPDMEGEQDAIAYMFAAIRSNALRYIRTRGGREPARGNTARAIVLQDVGKSPVDIAIQAETAEEDQRLLELAMRGIEELPGELSEALMLVILRDPPMKLREVAEIQKVSIATVHKRIERALDALRTIDETIGSKRTDDNTRRSS